MENANFAAAVDATVACYLSEFGQDAEFDEGWFTAAYEVDTETGGELAGLDCWPAYRDAARAAWAAR